MLLTTTGSTPNNFLYSGEQYDSALGLYYLRARYYNPATGRFLAMDPYQGSFLDPATLHKYVYAGNNPVNDVDPTGRSALLEGVYLDLNPGLTTVEVPRGLGTGLIYGCYGVAGYDLGNLLLNGETPKPLGVLRDIMALLNPPWRE
jgi:RHS repeat-associated protein